MSDERLNVTQASLNSTGEGGFLVTGDLVFATVGDLLDQAGPTLASVPDPVLDLTAVVNCDSAGLVLLLEWVAAGAAAGKRVRFRNLPPALVGIARLSNAESLLPLAD